MRRQTAIGLLVAGILGVAPLAAFGCDENSDLAENDGIYKLTILKTGSGLIETHPGGLECKDNACTVTYQGVHNVTMIGIPNNGSTVRFDSTKCNGASQCTIALDKDTTIRIYFEDRSEDQGHPGDTGC